MFLLWALFFTTSIGAAEVKYVFFFLGDGMSSSQIQTTEAYLASANAKSTRQALGPEAGNIDARLLMHPSNRLRFTQFPIMGMQTTYDAYSLNTDSASAGTAFASGIKTKSNMINMDPDQNQKFKSIAELAHERGMKVGILTSVSIDHATPASYYASVASRSYFNSIASQLAASGFEFFGGGGFVSPQKAAKSGDTNNDVHALLKQNGYTILNDRSSILNLKTQPKSKVVAINSWLQDSAALPYHLDKIYYDEKNQNLTLSEMTEVAIANLEALDRKDGGKGFFIMVEGGKIDWACHANDAMASILDMMDFDAAIGQAIDFFIRHPNETLIVVTGDHETGGMSVGHATTAYKAYYDKMFAQKASFQYFTDNQWKAHKQKYSQGYDGSKPDNLSSNAEMVALMHHVFGLDWNSLNDYQKQRLEDAYDQSMAGKSRNSDAANKLLYGGYEPITVTITHILNETAGIGWTSYSHTGQPVPLFAKGYGAETFAGFYDNTDIAKKLASVMNISQTLPVVK
uniref:Alkaline phosphatase n=1 Tax=Desulfatirhabdium butyrativorans TaxID=340467 RepID=A0A7C4RQ44_9BACT